MDTIEKKEDNHGGDYRKSHWRFKAWNYCSR
jgi:hypothetical protein